jgi:polyisoprenoid-binding protein YceI
MSARYSLDPGRSRFTVQAFATGVLSYFAHSPTFAVRDFRGEVRFEGEGIDRMSLELTVNADSLELLDRVSPADRREIEDRMLREVLEMAAFPEVTFRSADVTADPLSRGLYRVKIGGQLLLHGETRPLRVVAELRLFVDGLRLQGSCPLRMSDYRIGPVAALGGAIRLKDELAVSFDISGFPEGS